MFTIDIHKLLDQFLYNPDEPLIFSSGMFLLLFTAFVWIYIVLSNTQKPKLIFVTLFSLYFYYKSSGYYFVLLLSATLIDYVLAQWIYNTDLKWKRKIFVVLSISINLIVLGYFKYTNFLFETFTTATGEEFEHFDIHFIRG